MSENNNQTSQTNDDQSSEFPVAAIVCLSVGGYVILVILFLVIRRMLVSKGSCQSECCYPESGVCCSVCEKINQSCASCCSCADCKCCWLCSAQKRANYRDILCISCDCISCDCTGGCCRSCSRCVPSILCDCQDCSLRCCTRKPTCPSCYDNDIDPNACGCLCLEIKLRTSQRESVRRGASTSLRGAKNQNFTAQEQPDKTPIYHHENVYHDSGRLDNNLNQTAGNFVIVDENNSDRQRSLSLSPRKSASHRYQMSSNRSNNADIPDILSLSTQDRKHPSDKTNAHVNFQGNLQELYDSYDKSDYLPSSTIFTSSSSGDSHNLSSRTLLNKSTNTDSGIESTGRSTSRSRKVIRPGQMSQRFPNKILVSSESLKLSLEKTMTTAPEVSFIQSSDRSLPNMLTDFDALNTRRPLPSITKTRKPVT